MTVLLLFQIWNAIRIGHYNIMVYYNINMPFSMSTVELVQADRQLSGKVKQCEGPNVQCGVGQGENQTGGRVQQEGPAFLAGRQSQWPTCECRSHHWTVSVRTILTPCVCWSQTCTGNRLVGTQYTPYTQYTVHTVHHTLSIVDNTQYLDSTQ